jgi:hypothetical protein
MLLPKVYNTAYSYSKQQLEVVNIIVVLAHCAFNYKIEDVKKS